MIIGKLGLSFVGVGKLEPGIENYEDLVSANEVPPRFGRNWWFWKPKIRWNILGKQNTIERFGVHWLCFMFDVQWWK